MKDKTKRIVFSSHAKERLEHRGALDTEVTDAIRQAPWHSTEYPGRYECRKNYPFNNIWNKKQYESKQVHPVFVEETDNIVVITVYTYFF